MKVISREDVLLHRVYANIQLTKPEIEKLLSDGVLNYEDNELVLSVVIVEEDTDAPSG